VGDAGGVQPLRLLPHRVKQFGADLVGSECVELASLDVLHGHDHRPVGQRRQGAEVGTGDASAAGEQEEQAFVLDIASERRRRPVVAGISQQQ
jgi:hypothetical protein